MRPALEVADIFRHHGAAFRQAHAGHVGGTERRVMVAIEACRRHQALGGHVERCVDCGFVRCAYNSCRDRHCPKCQGLARAEWLEARQAELLPVPLLPRRVHRARFGCGHRVPQQGGRLYHPVSRCGRGAAQRRSRHSISRRRDRRDRRVAYLGAGPAPASTPALHRPCRRHLARPDTLDCLPI